MEQKYNIKSLETPLSKTLDDQVNAIINSNLNFIETAKKNSMTIKNTQRYFLRYVRKRLGSSDT